VSIKPKKSLGQHFLIDDNIARNILRDLHPTSNDVIVEIGPGKGALTQHLSGTVKKLIAVEIDIRVMDELKEKFLSPDVVILHKDFLEVDLKAISRQEGQQLRLVGNIPYNLTSEILVKAFDERSAVRDFTFMVQREVAHRLAAKPGTKEYGILSVYAQFYGRLKILFSVSPNCFYPKPNVSSAVIQEQLFESLPFAVDEQMFRMVVRTTFGKRRKTLRNSLKFLPQERGSISNMDSPSNLFDKRPEQLSVGQFVELANMLSRHTSRIPHSSFEHYTNAFYRE
jgi:16S rRNA (adenine1518-N6/adenine1519-N6)-dimethyltransferase